MALFSFVPDFKAGDFKTGKGNISQRRYKTEKSSFFRIFFHTPTDLYGSFFVCAMASLSEMKREKKRENGKKKMVTINRFHASRNFAAR